MKTNGLELFNPNKQVVIADSGANGVYVLPVLDGSNLVNLPIQSGAAGSAATIAIGTVTSGEVASVVNSGDSTNAVLDFVLPAGPQGPQGSQGVPGASGYTPVKGIDYFDGSAATIKIGTVTSGAVASVSNGGTANSAVLNFVLPIGPQGSKGDSGYTPVKGTDYFDGSAATIEIGTVTSGASAFVSNGGTATSAVLNFVLPIGPQGSKGDSGYTPIKGTDYFDGVSPHVSSVVITMIEPNGTASASVTGEQTNLTVNLFIPRGSQGIQGPEGSQGAQGNAFTYADFTTEQLEGLRGPQGSQGISGASGAKGADGVSPEINNVIVTILEPNGTASATITGDQSDLTVNLFIPRGSQGAQGSQGVPGSAFTYADFTEEQLEGLRGPQGSQGISGASGAKGADGVSPQVSSVSVTMIEPDAIASGKIDGAQTSLAVNLYLPRGSKGDKGDAFTYSDFTAEQLEGLRGPQGSQGISGASGAKGTDGVSPQVSSAVVTMIEPDGTASASITGEQTNLTVNLFIPRGSQGPQGSTGPQGEAFTYADFTAEQLEGLRGPQGSQGSKGESGYTPVKGTDYFDGSAATIEIGTVTSGASAFVSNGGTATSAVLNFVLPIGPEGPRGTGKYFEYVVSSYPGDSNVVAWASSGSDIVTISHGLETSLILNVCIDRYGIVSGSATSAVSEQYNNYGFRTLGDSAVQLRMPPDFVCDGNDSKFHSGEWKVVVMGI